MSFSWRGRAEGTDALGRHLTFDAILGLFRDCWASFFPQLDAGLDPAWMLLRHLRADFAAEVLAGEAEVTLTVLATGRTSVRLELTARQAGRRVAGLEAVFVRCDPVSGKPRELAGAELSALSRYRAAGQPGPGALTTTRAGRRPPPASGPS
jgi:acyl-CoA thioesterase FadM